MRPRRPTLTTCAASLVLMSLAGCGQSSGVAQAGAAEPPIAVQTEAVAIPEPFVAELPGDFPHDIWLPARHRLTTLMPMGQSLIVSLSADATLQELISAYEFEMSRNDWASSMRFESQGDAMLGYAKDGRTVVVTLTVDTQGGTVVSLQISTG
jgi:hypothetical protein